VSRLVAKEQRRAEEAEARRNEMGALYELSVDLFAATNRVGALGDAAGRALRSIGARGGALVLFPETSEGGEVVVATGDHRLDLADPLLVSVLRSGDPAELPSADGARDAYLPLALGGRPSGVLLVRGTRPSFRPPTARGTPTFRWRSGAARAESSWSAGRGPIATRSRP
jgi:hypothetical protein